MGKKKKESDINLRIPPPKKKTFIVLQILLRILTSHYNPYEISYKISLRNSEISSKIISSVFGWLELLL